MYVSDVSGWDSSGIAVSRESRDADDKPIGCTVSSAGQCTVWHGPSLDSWKYYSAIETSGASMRHETGQSQGDL